MFLEFLQEGLTLAQSIGGGSPLDEPIRQVGTFQHEITHRASSDMPEELIPVVGIVMGCSIAIVAIICGMISSGQREKTRRDIAAYVAEGSISPEDGERMLRAASMDTKKS
jgi:hypothetical protein